MNTESKDKTALEHIDEEIKFYTRQRDKAQSEGRPVSIALCDAKIETLKDVKHFIQVLEGANP